MALHAISVKAARRRLYAPELGCDRVTVYGFRAACSCGWESEVSRSYAEAQRFGRAHREEDGR